MLLGVDVGGTFTDAVLLDAGAVHTAKVPTTPGNESDGVMDAVAAVLGRAGAEAAAVDVFAHGMTVGTNALLEERGARTALVATEGFADLLEIGRQDRPHLYRLCAPKPVQRPLKMWLGGAGEKKLLRIVAQHANPRTPPQPLRREADKRPRHPARRRRRPLTRTRRGQPSRMRNSIPKASACG